METIGKHLLIYDNVTYYLLTNKVVLFKHPLIYSQRLNFMNLNNMRNLNTVSLRLVYPECLSGVSKVESL